MLGKLFSIMVLIAFVCGAITGNMQKVCESVLTGASDAVSISISLVGMMCFWNGIMRVFDRAGVSEKLARLMNPVLKKLYSADCEKSGALEDIAASFSANFLGLGSAALPIGMRAMEKMGKNASSDVATHDMILFSALNTTPFQLVPSTLIALRTFHGSASPFEIIAPVWICSVLTILFNIVLCKILSGRKRGRYDP